MVRPIGPPWLPGIIDDPESTSSIAVSTALQLANSTRHTFGGIPQHTLRSYAFSVGYTEINALALNLLSRSHKGLRRRHMGIGGSLVDEHVMVVKGVK
jgi:hypothetical protein